ncbi:MAG: type II toxin-antitoxin system VapC family toxin [Nitrospirae bacterium]|nr:type II toxin-antitoxin system VapC family toxin [Nitrospirota bacterium]
MIKTSIKTKLYLDTSIPSAYFDYSKPLRQLVSQKWFENEALNFELYISVVTIEEVERMVNIKKKTNIKELLLDNNVKILKLTSEAIKLADQYVKEGAIPQSEPADAYHIAIASTYGIDALASWNFKHIVSINPIKKIHEINKRLNYQVIEIGSLELFGGAKYGSL